MAHNLATILSIKVGGFDSILQGVCPEYSLGAEEKFECKLEFIQYKKVQYSPILKRKISMNLLEINGKSVWKS